MGIYYGGIMLRKANYNKNLLSKIIFLLIVFNFLIIPSSITHAATPLSILYPTSGATIIFHNPVISGIGVPGYTVTLTVTDSYGGSYTYNGGVGSDSKWSIRVANSLIDGSYNVVASQPAPYSSSVSSNFVILSDPTPVTINVQGGNAVTNSTRPYISGTAVPYSKLGVFIDDVDQKAVINVDGNGYWNYVPGTDLCAGDHTFYAKVPGTTNSWEISSKVKTTIDTTPPTVPAIDASINNIVTNNTKPIISGTGELNSRITVNVDGTDYNDVVITDAQGKWVYTPSNNLTSGNHVIKAKAWDMAGNISQASVPVYITIDTVPPAVPIINEPVNSLVTSNKKITIKGQAEPKSKVSIKIDNAEITDAATADANGNFSYSLSSDLSEGTHSICARAKDSANNIGSFCASTIVTIDSIPPSIPIITRPGNNLILSDTRPVILGSSEINSKLLFNLDGVDIPQSDIKYDIVGNWTYIPQVPLSQGLHKISVKAVDGANNTSQERVSVFTVDTIKPDIPVINNPANNSVNLPQLTIDGKCEANANIIIIIDGTEIQDPIVADQGGNWSYKLKYNLAKGFHLISVNSKDAAGNISDNQRISIKIVDKYPTVVPVITSPVNNSSTKDDDVLITGTAEPNSKIVINVDNKDLDAQVTSDAAGSFNFLLSAGLKEGTHTIRVKSIGSISKMECISKLVRFNLDRTSPAAPIIISPCSNSKLREVNNLIRGMAEPNSLVTVMIDNLSGTTLTYRAKASLLGSWSVAASKKLPPGNYVITAEAKDAADNTSKLGKIIRVTVALK